MPAYNIGACFDCHKFKKKKMTRLDVLQMLLITSYVGTFNIKVYNIKVIIFIFMLF